MAQKPLTPSVMYISRIPKRARSTYFWRTCGPLGETKKIGRFSWDQKYELSNYGKEFYDMPMMAGFVLLHPTTKKQTLTRSTCY
jgi:hypothetical protein